MYAALKAHNLKPDNNVATAWDAGFIVVAALRKLGPTATAAQLREYIDNLTDFAGVDGMYDFKKISAARSRARGIRRLRPMTPRPKSGCGCRSPAARR